MATRTPAQRRLAATVLAWGGDRPVPPPGLATRLREGIEEGLAPCRDALERLAARDRRRRLSLTAAVVGRSVCDGWQLEPEPFTPRWTTARAMLARHAVLHGLTEARDVVAERVVADAWTRLASRAPGDPASVSSWLNRRSNAESTSLRDEGIDLVRLARDVWPPLPESVVSTTIDRVVSVPLLGGVIRLHGAVDLALESRHDDGRARRLVVSLRTGRPRAGADRDAARFAALLSTLDSGAPPFRWATYHVTEGRVELEDLDPSVLEGEGARIAAAARQRARLAEVPVGAPDDALRLTPGWWCGFCRRREVCGVRVATGP